MTRLEELRKRCKVAQQDCSKFCEVHDWYADDVPDLLNVVEAAKILMQGSNRIVIEWQNRLKEALKGVGMEPIYFEEQDKVYDEYGDIKVGASERNYLDRITEER